MLKGAAEMRAKLMRVAAQFPNRVAAAIYQEAQIEMTEAKRRTPVAVPSWYIDQGYGKYRGVPGTLRASGFVAEPVRNGNNISVTLSFGGAASDYAIPVHEILDSIHPVGQAKFLESTLDESRPFMKARIARRLDLNNMRIS